MDEKPFTSDRKRDPIAELARLIAQVDSHEENTPSDDRLREGTVSDGHDETPELPPAPQLLCGSSYSERSESRAQAAFRALQAKYPNELGGQQPTIRRADLGAAGTYYRALVGSFASAEKAAKMCSELKAAGGDCVIQKN